jgi:cell division septation protein DedD
MDPGLKQRLVGAAVLVALAVIFLPMLVQGPAPDSGVSDVPLTMPDAPRGEYETRDLPLVTPGNAPDGGAVGMDAAPPAASASQALPLEGSDAASTAEPLDAATPSTGTPLPADSGATGNEIFPAATAGGDYAVSFGSFTTASTAEPLDAAAPPASTPLSTDSAAGNGNEMFPAATAGGDYAVSFGSFTTATAADAVVASLRGSQLPGYREAAQVDGKAVQRVRIGPYATRADAEAARLRAAHVRDDVSARVVVLDAEVAEPKPAPVTVKPVAPTPKPVATAPAPKPVAPAPVAPAATGTGFAVQLAAFSKPADATALRDKARAAGFSAFTESVATDKGTLTRVRIGPVASRAEAEQLQAQVKAKLGVAGIVRPHP